MAVGVSLVHASETSVTIAISGSVTADNAPELDKNIKALRAENPQGKLTLDLENLDYISSAGLRIVIMLARRNKGLMVINANEVVYDIFEVTGIVEIVDVRRAPREISVEGCEIIGRGGYGTVYRIDPETIVKVYLPTCSLEFVDNERELSRNAFIMGVPTAIPYDLVTVGDCYGLVFELLECKTLSELIADDPDRISEVAQRAVETLKELHSIEVPEGKLRDRADTLINYYRNEVSKFLDAEEIELIVNFLESIPRGNTFLHDDYHFKNIVEVDGELMLIDIGDAAKGNPMFDVAQMGLAFIMTPGAVEQGLLPPDILGFDVQYCQRIWGEMIARYFGVDGAGVQRITGALLPLVFLIAGYSNSNFTAGDDARARAVAESLVRGQAVPLIRQMPTFAL